MAEALLKEVEHWHKVGTKIAIFKGVGKAFCAGGDVKALYLIKKGLATDAGMPNVTHFFRTEYTADWKVATMAPLQIALWDGYVMGGGVGISIHAP